MLKNFGHRRSDSRPPMPYQNDGHIFAVISKRWSYLISKWKSLWEHTPPFFCLFAFQTAGRDLSTVRSTEGLLFTNPGSSAKISLAEDRRRPDENYSFTGTPFQPTVRCLIRFQCLACIVSNSGQPEHAVGVYHPPKVSHPFRQGTDIIEKSTAIAVLFHV